MRDIMEILTSMVLPNEREQDILKVAEKLYPERMQEISSKLEELENAPRYEEFEDVFTGELCCHQDAAYLLGIADGIRMTSFAAEINREAIAKE